MQRGVIQDSFYAAPLAWLPSTDHRISMHMNSISLLPRAGLDAVLRMFAALVLGWMGTMPVGAASNVQSLSSPDGRIRVLIELPEPTSGDRPRWSAEFRGRQLLADCQAGLKTVDGGELLAGVRLVRERRRSVNDRIPVLFGKAARADDRYREARFTLENPQRRRVDLVFRCYYDAVALRYELPEDAPGNPVVIADETTSFHGVGAPTAYVQYLENYKTSHEHPVIPVSYDTLRSGALLDLPLTLGWPDGTYVAITEAALRHYAGMALSPSTNESSGPRLLCKLTPRPDGMKVVRALPMKTPWRVVMMAERPGALLESTTLYCLNEPSRINDTSWIKPGKITFSWWNGDVYDGRPGESVLSFAMAKKYIDFCARNGLPTHSIGWTEPPTAPWYHQSKRSVEPGPDTDVTRPREDFDLPAIRRYADSKQVRLWTWVHQAALRGRVEEAFAAFEKMGWSGMMVDFFDHDDQESVEFAESVVQAAARHHILVQLHGVWKPTGWERTYPNLVNHEGALNLEYLKWSDRCTPEHNLMLAFTRLVAGPMDYHLGGFRALPRSAFKARAVAPHVLGTRCHMLGMYVCFDNSNPMLADYPAAYEDQPGFDFLKLVPTWWDETRVLVGDIGEVLVTARRKGQVWYLGGISARRGRDLELPLSFLEKGHYTARLWRDAPDAETEPNRLVTETRSVSTRDRLQIHFAPDGGFVAQLTPAK